MDFLNTAGSCATKLHRSMMKQKEQTIRGESCRK